MLPLIFWMKSVLPLLGLSLAFSAINAWAIARHYLPGLHAGSPGSLGTAFYPLALALLLVLFWDNSRHLIALPFVVMVFADPAAGYVGRKARPSARLPLPGDRKSLPGSIAMLATTYILVVFYSFFTGYPALPHALYRLLFALVIAAIATAAEMLAYRGSDNLSVPLLVAAALYAVAEGSLFLQLTLATVLALSVALLSCFWRLLTFSGCVAAFLLGSFIFGIGGWPYAIPILLFFLLSSALSKSLRADRRDTQGILAKGGQRDAQQVLANGLVPMAVVIAGLYGSLELLYPYYLAAVAAASADTWATEIGMSFGKQPRSILTGELVVAGTSGGVTLAGTSGALLAGVLIAGIGCVLAAAFEFRLIGAITFVFIAFSAILAQIVDSFLGAAFQRVFRCPVCGGETERRRHCGRDTQHLRGVVWMDNDLVNLLCSVSGVLFTYILLRIFMNTNI